MRLVRLWTCALLAAAGGALFNLPVTLEAQSSGVIRGCVLPSGQTRILGPGESCKSNETATTWNIQGPTGAKGATGATGADGQQGPKGDMGPRGFMGNIGPQGLIGPTGPAGKDGIDGAVGPTGSPGTNADAGGSIVGRLVFGCDAVPSAYNDLGARVRIRGTNFEANIGPDFNEKKGGKKGPPKVDPDAFAIVGVPPGTWVVQAGVMRSQETFDGLIGNFSPSTLLFVPLAEIDVTVENGRVTDLGNWNTEEECVTAAACVTQGLDYCAGACANLASDANNCGACGVVCSLKEICSNGVCGSIKAPPPSPCDPGLLLCGTTCVDAQTDVNNCGACGQACGSGYACVSGVCAPAAGGSGGAPPDGGGAGGTATGGSGNTTPPATVACGSFTDQQSCEAQASCLAVIAGTNCQRPDGTTCQASDSSCVCEPPYTFQACVAR